MPRQPRSAPPGLVYHVINRSIGRLKLFRTDKDYQAFLDVIADSHRLAPLPILDFVVMPDHWHFIVRPKKPDQLSAYFRRLTLTHSMRWHVAHRTLGQGPVYQGRFRCFPVQQDEHLPTICRYLQRNALRAALVQRASDWRWGSFEVRRRGTPELQECLAPWPVEEPANWQRWVNAAQPEPEIEAIRLCVRRSRPYGDPAWTLATARRLGIEHSINPPGRPRKNPLPVPEPKRRNAR